MLEKTLTALHAREWTLATAESCTGGMIAAHITDRAGTSKYFERGFVTYSNESKTDLLGVDPMVLEAHGAVSSAVAVAMAEGALKNSRANIAVAVTGIAGPDGGTEEKPVGLVFIAVAFEQQSAVYKHQFDGDRASVRSQTVAAALEHVVRHLEAA